MQLTVDNLTRIYNLLQEYPTTVNVQVQNDGKLQNVIFIDENTIIAIETLKRV